MESLALPSPIPFILSLARRSLDCLRVMPGEKNVSSSPIHRRTKSAPSPWHGPILPCPIPFLFVAADKAVLRFEDLQQLVEFLRQEQTHHQEGR